MAYTGEKESGQMTDRRSINLELIKEEDAPRVGVDEIDAQHAAMIGLVNRLHQAMMQREEREILDAIIAELIRHTHRHFSYEEQLMAQTRYPGYPAHKADHDKLMKHITDLAEQFRGGDLLLSFAVMVDLKAWATIHIEESDGPLGLFLNKQDTHAQ
jgi:hemerythrin